jgi:hypothetical protein
MRREANGNPSIAASCALNVLDPSSQIGTRNPAPGTARTIWSGCSGPSRACNSMTSWGKFSSDVAQIPAQRARGTLIGAGCAAEREIDAAPVKRFQRTECSAMTSGALRCLRTPPWPCSMQRTSLANWREAANRPTQRSSSSKAGEIFSKFRWTISTTVFDNDNAIVDACQCRLHPGLLHSQAVGVDRPKLVKHRRCEFFR